MHLYGRCASSISKIAVNNSAFFVRYITSIHVTMCLTVPRHRPNIVKSVWVFCPCGTDKSRGLVNLATRPRQQCRGRRASGGPSTGSPRFPPPGSVADVALPRSPASTEPPSRPWVASGMVACWGWFWISDGSLTADGPMCAAADSQAQVQCGPGLRGPDGRCRPRQQVAWSPTCQVGPPPCVG